MNNPSDKYLTKKEILEKIWEQMQWLESPHHILEIRPQDCTRKAFKFIRKATWQEEATLVE